MAFLKYTDKDGNIVAVSQYKVNDIQIVHQTGENEDKVMSQKSVTDELNKIIPFIKYDAERDTYILDCGTF